MTTAASIPPLAVRGLTRTFPGVRANEDITLAFHVGEVHALLGENGAGKSTLIGVLAGLGLPDAGTVLVAGRERVLGSPRASREAGIGVVAQHPQLVPTLSVVDNVTLGDRGRARTPERDRARVRGIAAELGIVLDPDARVGTLGLVDQARLGVLRALWASPRVLILDEPTALLTPDAAATLLASLRGLAHRGIAVVLVTHRLDEVLAVADRVSVLRAGRLVDELGPDLLGTPGEAVSERILSAMFGASAGSPEGSTRSTPALGGEPLLEVRAVSSDAVDGDVAAREISLSIAAGEILGVAGIDGHGQRALAELFGGQRAPRTGQILLEGREIGGLGVAARRRLGVRSLSADRLGEGIVPALSVEQNLRLTSIGVGPLWRRGFLRTRAARAEAAAIVDAADIRTPSLQTPAGSLSGGNIQRLVLARELTAGARLAVVSMPTAGLDLASVRRVRARLAEVAAAGTAIVLITSDLAELEELASRVIVLADGRVRDTLERGPELARRIGAVLTGVDA